ncbi:MAG: SH3 domain-containing protein [Clostridia bacterium]|nr:SH3 domain-containing protein [Clostridia bacterium]
MKKLLSLLLAAVLIFSLASCGKKEECILLFRNDGKAESLDLSYDLTGDGMEDDIKIALTEDYYIKVAVGESEISLGYGEAYYIDKVYAIDLDTKEKGLELVLISEEVSSDMMMRVLKPEGDTFRLYEFESVDTYSGEPYLWDTLSVGFEPEISFKGGVLKTSERGRTGMWCVEAEYVFDGEKFTEVEMEERKVVRPSYNSEWWPDLSDEDKKAMDEGYVIAKADFENYGDVPEHDDMADLKAGDWFKITKEDSEGFVFIEKKSGESGWIYMGNFADNRYDVSEMVFFLAD